MADLNSPEHLAALAARRAGYGPRGSRDARGPHIRDEPDGKSVVAFDSQLDEAMERIAVLEDERERSSQKEPDMQIPKTRFDGTINTGNILVLAAMLLSGVLAYGAYTGDMAKRDAQNDARMTALQVQITDNKRAADDRAAHYAPMIDEARRMNEAQNQRQENFVDSLKNMRDMLAEVIKTMQEQTKANAEMHEAVTVLRMQLERLNPPGPRGG